MADNMQAVGSQKPERPKFPGRPVSPFSHPPQASMVSSRPVVGAEASSYGAAPPAGFGSPSWPPSRPSYALPDASPYQRLQVPQPPLSAQPLPPLSSPASGQPMLPSPILPSMGQQPMPPPPPVSYRPLPQNPPVLMGPPTRNVNLMPSRTPPQSVLPPTQSSMHGYPYRQTDVVTQVQPVTTPNFMSQGGPPSMGHNFMIQGGPPSTSLSSREQMQYPGAGPPLGAMQGLVEEFSSLSVGSVPGSMDPGVDPKELPRPLDGDVEPKSFSESYPLNCDPRYLRLTTSGIPNSQSLLSRWHLPLGAVVHPLAEAPDGEEVPVVNFGPSGIIRCRRCRTYVNPYVVFTDGGKKWRCNICALLNDGIQYMTNMTGEQIQAPSSPRDGEDVSINLGRPQPSGLKLGTLMGVFVPCLQNIMGIIYYIRFSWIVGMGGIGESLVLVSFCGLCTFLTGISLSAIATNGAMKGGGPYYLIGRALGPEVGVSIGLCFFLGNAGSGSLYVLGAVETFLDAVPAAGIFRGNTTVVNATSGAQSHIETPNLHDLQVYGIVVTICLCFIVFGGVKMINRVAPAFLIPVILSLFCIFIGMAIAKDDDPSPGITGLSLKTFKDNWSSDYQRTNSAGVPDPEGEIYWNFNALVGLFFPAVTGIMAGSNRSASLKDTQRSIPIGTLAATLTTSALYLISVLFFGALATREKLLKDRLLTATVAWPVPAVIYVGIVLSTLGAALQSLTGAPRLLAAIANDDILPVLNYFKVAEGSEPYIATLFTALICIGCVTIGNLDLITPTITMFFLLCYAGVNLSCFLLDLLDAPSWRPRWKFHHWSLSLLGATLCIVIMFLISWSFTVVSLALASLIYYYVSIKGKAGDWGDGIKSAYFQLALRSLRSLGANQVHPKNWYPIPLIFCRPWGKLPENVPCHPKLADFANFMKKKGRGMSIFVSILDGDYHECAEDAKAACRQLSTYIEYKRCEGVAEIVVAPNMSEGFRGIVQTMGLGNLKPNIVVMRYPEIWRRENLIQIPTTFVGIINDCIVANKAVVIVKGLDEWPNEYQRQYGTIDLYWIVRDGGLMLLLSQLLLTKESFESCKIQVFCIAEEDTEAEDLKADVKKFLYDLRMQAEVIVLNMKSWEPHVEGNTQQEESVEAFTGAQKRIAEYLKEMKEKAQKEGTPLMADGKPVVVNEQQVEKFLYTTLKLNSTILRHSRMAAVVLVSLPAPPVNHPSYFYMEYMDLLVENVPRLLMVRGYRKDVVTLFT